MALSQYIADNYGSKKGFLRFYKYKALGLLSSKYRSTLPPKGSVKRLVFICSGNICRSAFGESVARAKGFPAVSYGLHCRGGDAAFEKTQGYAREHGYDLSSHTTQNIKHYVPVEGDLLLVVEPAHSLEIPVELGEVPFAYIGQFSPVANAYLHDPYSANTNYFAKNMQAIEIAVIRILERL